MLGTAAHQSVKSISTAFSIYTLKSLLDIKYTQQCIYKNVYVCECVNVCCCVCIVNYAGIFASQTKEPWA